MTFLIWERTDYIFLKLTHESARRKLSRLFVLIVIPEYILLYHVFYDHLPIFMGQVF